MKSDSLTELCLLITFEWNIGHPPSPTLSPTPTLPQQKNKAFSDLKPELLKPLALT